MKVTQHAPNTHSSKFKRTKIIATVGPSTNNYEAILGLLKAGANGIRLNFSHGTHEERVEQIKWVRKASKEYGKPVAIIQDIQGPKMRLGDFDGIVNVQTGQSLRLQYKSDYTKTGILPTQYDLSKKVRRGERIYMYDGKVCTVVSSVKDGVVHVTAENNGILIKRKGVNLPDTDFGGDILTKKDLEDIAFGSTQDIDYVALSFVQSAADVEYLKRVLKNHNSNAKIIAKVETNAAIGNIEEIVRSADAVMVARGDLAIETMAEAVPVVQRRIISLCRTHSKPSIVATHMLASMTETPEPTRAEVSDVATAVLLGADCVMLSDETASGKYPLEAVQIMKRIILYTESNAHEVSVPLVIDQHPTKQSAISRAIISLAETTVAAAIVAETKSGATAGNISALRPHMAIIAVTSTDRVAQQMALMYGVKSFVRPDDKFAATKLTNWLLRNKVMNKGDIVVTSSGKYPGVVGSTDTIKIRVLE